MREVKSQAAEEGGLEKKKEGELRQKEREPEREREQRPARAEVGIGESALRRERSDCRERIGRRQRRGRVGGQSGEW